MFLALAQKTVTTHQHARVKVVVDPRPSAGSRAVTQSAGDIKVLVKGRGRTRRVAARLHGHRGDVKLPKLPKGVYRVRAKYLGNDVLKPARSPYRRLKVVGGTGVAASGSCLPTAKDPGGSDPWGTCWPGPNNTGVPPGTQLTAISGDRTITTAGQVVNGWNVSGCINVDALDVTIKNSQARCVILDSGTPARYCHYGESPALRSLSGCTVVAGVSDDSDPSTNDPRLTIEDSEIDCHGVPGNTGTAIGDRNMNVIRVDIHGCENGFDADSYMTITDSYIHDLYNSVDGDPHTDGLQSGIGAYLTIDHNVFYGFTPPCVWPNNGSCNGTSAINIGGQPNQATSANTTVSRNLLAGGAYTMYCPYLSPTNFKITANYFSTVYSPKVGEYGPTADQCRSSGITSSGNVKLNYSTGRTTPFTP